METREKIIKIRESAGLSQAAFAEKVDCSQNYIHLIETGKRKPSAKFVRDLLSQLDVRAEWWETGEGDIFTVKEKPLEDDLKRLVDMVTDELIADARARHAELDLMEEFLAVRREWRKKKGEP